MSTPYHIRCHLAFSNEGWHTCLPFDFQFGGGYCRPDRGRYREVKDQLEPVKDLQRPIQTSSLTFFDRMRRNESPDSGLDFTEPPWQSLQ